MIIRPVRLFSSVRSCIFQQAAVVANYDITFSADCCPSCHVPYMLVSFFRIIVASVPVCRIISADIGVVIDVVVMTGSQ